MHYRKKTERSLPSGLKAHEACGLEAGSQGLSGLRLGKRFHHSTFAIRHLSFLHRSMGGFHAGNTSNTPLQKSVS